MKRYYNNFSDHQLLANSTGYIAQIGPCVFQLLVDNKKLQYTVLLDVPDTTRIVKVNDSTPYARRCKLAAKMATRVPRSLRIL